MKNNKVSPRDCMRIPAVFFMAAVLFQDISWLPKLAGLLMIACSVFMMVDAYKRGLRFIYFHYGINLLLIAASIYIIIAI